MNKINSLIALMVAFIYGNVQSQVLCIYCYDQNNPVSTGVNNLILNGGFENGCYVLGQFCPASSGFACNITNWTCTGGGVATYACVWDTAHTFVPEGNKALYFGNFHVRTCSNLVCDTSCINNIGCTVTGIPSGYPLHPDPGYGNAVGVSLEQTVSGLIPGNTYVLEFWAGGEYALNVRRGLFAVDVGFGKTYLRDNATPPITGIGTRYIIEFVATSASHTIKFTSWGHICAATELVLDDVQLYTLAELSPSVPQCFLGMNDGSSSFDIPVISPNPFNQYLTISTNQFVKDKTQIKLFDIYGRTVLSKPLTTGNTKLQTVNLSSGIYIYEVSNNGGVIRKGKVVKE